MPEEATPPPVEPQNPVNPAEDPFAGLPAVEMQPVKRGGRPPGRKNNPKKELKPATKAKAEKIVKKLVADALPVVAKGLEAEAALGWRAAAEYAALREKDKAIITSLLGEDIEEAKRHFADYLLAGARKMAGLIIEEANELPPQARAFAMSVLIDKSEALRAKQASTSGGARVAIQINNYGDVDRDALIRDLHPEVNVTQPKDKS